jgi:hypothetical protein
MQICGRNHAQCYELCSGFNRPRVLEKFFVHPLVLAAKVSDRFIENPLWVSFIMSSCITLEPQILTWPLRHRNCCREILRGTWLHSGFSSEPYT